MRLALPLKWPPPSQKVSVWTTFRASSQAWLLQVEDLGAHCTPPLQLRGSVHGPRSCAGIVESRTAGEAEGSLSQGLHKATLSLFFPLWASAVSSSFLYFPLSGNPGTRSAKTNT